VPSPDEFLARLPDPDADALVACGTRRSWRAGEIVFTEGEPADRVVVLLTGRVKVSSLSDTGEVVLAFRGRGALLGEISAIDRGPRSATVTAVDRVDGLEISAVAFWNYLAGHPAASLLLLRTLAGRLRDADRKRIEFGAYDTTGRVAARLVEMAERFGQPTEEGLKIALPFSQDELAGWTGASREAVSKALGALRSRGLIRTSRMSVVVKDLDALRARSQ
jgi:CRP/FNR family cyclic AMP-dependent transcriptional regulator